MQREAKFDLVLANQASDWISAITGEEIGDSSNLDEFATPLLDGSLLCLLINTLQPGSVKKINSSKMAFKMVGATCWLMDNNRNFFCLCADGKHRQLFECM